MRRIFTALFYLMALGFLLPVTLSAESFTLVTDASSLQVGDEILIVNTENAKAISTTQQPNNRLATSVTITNNSIIPGDDVQIITLQESVTSGEWYLEVGSDNLGRKQYLYAADTNDKNNHLKTGSLHESGNSSCTITFGTDNNATITFKGSATRNRLQYNPNTSAKPVVPIFSCYKTDQEPVQIYKKGEGGSVEPTPDPEPEVKELGQPVYTINGKEVTVSVENAGLFTYDFYYLDQTKGDVKGEEVMSDSFTITVDAIGTLEFQAIGGDDVDGMVSDTKSFWFEENDEGVEEWRLVDSADELAVGGEYVIGSKNMSTTSGAKEFNKLAAIGADKDNKVYTDRLCGVDAEYSTDRQTVTWEESVTPTVFTLGRNTKSTNYPYYLEFTYDGATKYLAGTDKTTVNFASSNEGSAQINIKFDNGVPEITFDPVENSWAREFLLNEAKTGETINGYYFRHYLTESKTDKNYNAVALYKKSGGAQTLVDYKYVMAPIQISEEGEHVPYQTEGMKEEDMLQFRSPKGTTVYYRWTELTAPASTIAKAAPNTPMTEAQMLSDGWSANEDLTETHNCVVIVPEIPTGKTLQLEVAALHEEYGLSDTVRFSTQSGVVVGIESVEVDADAPAEYFNLQGMRIDRPMPGTVAIKRQGGTVTKVLF